MAPLGFGVSQHARDGGPYWFAAQALLALGVVGAGRRCFHPRQWQSLERSYRVMRTVSVMMANPLFQRTPTAAAERQR
jgi:hypothetical protein